jgi:hypothetical protein
MKNDFFMYAQQEALAVGGLGAFAIWLDAELLQVRGYLCCAIPRYSVLSACSSLWLLLDHLGQQRAVGQLQSCNGFACARVAVAWQHILHPQLQCFPCAHTCTALKAPAGPS